MPAKSGHLCWPTLYKVSFDANLKSIITELLVHVLCNVQLPTLTLVTFRHNFKDTTHQPTLERYIIKQ